MIDSESGDEEGEGFTFNILLPVKPTNEINILEAKILEVYNTYWDAYLKGDIQTFASFLDENCQNEKKYNDHPYL